MQLEAIQHMETKPMIFTLKSPALTKSPSVVGKINLSPEDQIRFYHSTKKDEGQRQKLDVLLEKKLDGIPWSCGRVSLFAGKEFGVIKSKNNDESFFHPSNCDEFISNNEFVFFKSFYNENKGKYTAYHIRKPIIDDGYKVICDYFWGKVKLLKYAEPLQLRYALKTYADANWHKQSDYSLIISDLTPYLIQSGNGEVLNNRCESIISIASSEAIFKPQVTPEFMEQLADIVFPKLDQECLLSTFIYYHSSFKDILFPKIYLLSQENKMIFVQSYFLKGCAETAKLLMSFEEEYSLDSKFAQKCLYEKFKEINEIDRARLFFMGFDKKWQKSLSDSTIKQCIVAYESAFICKHYKEGLVSEQLVVDACCEILRKANARWDRKTWDTCIQTWTAEMPEIMNQVNRLLEEEKKRKEEERRIEAEKQRQEELRIQEERRRRIEEERRQAERKRAEETYQMGNLLRENAIYYFYHFTSRKNIASIRRNGGLYSWQYLKSHNIYIPVQGGGELSQGLDQYNGLADYVHLSFCKDHPMAYRHIQNGEDIIVLKISTDVATLEGTKFSDMNAVDSRSRCSLGLRGLSQVNFAATKEKYLRNDDPLFKYKQAEILVKTHVPLKYILNIDEF